MIAVDTNIFIYFIEKHPNFYQPSERAVRTILKEGGCISSLLFTEFIAGSPNTQINYHFEGLIEKLLKQGSLTIVDIDQSVAKKAGFIRSQMRQISTPDALHIAAALSAGATKFCTNDKQVAGCQSIDGLEIIPLTEY